MDDPIPRSRSWTSAFPLAKELFVKDRSNRHPQYLGVAAVLSVRQLLDSEFHLLYLPLAPSPKAENEKASLRSATCRSSELPRRDRSISPFVDRVARGSRRLKKWGQFAEIPRRYPVIVQPGGKHRQQAAVARVPSQPIQIRR
jgi:hypothetical protein